MSIVPLSKVTLYGTLPEREAVLAALQRMGCLHLLDLTTKSGEAINAKKRGQSERNEVAEAIRFLASAPKINPRQRTHYDPDQTVLSLARSILGLQQRIEEWQDQADQLQQQIESLEPWGDYRLLPAEQLGGQRLWFYRVPQPELPQLQQQPNAWQLIGQDEEGAAVVVVSIDRSELPWEDLELPDRPLTELRRERELIENKLESAHWQRLEQTHWLELLQQDLAATDDCLERLAAAHQTLTEEQLFVLQAWAPQPTLPALQAFAGQQRLALTVSSPAEDEQPPTLLQNPAAVAGAEEAVTFYMTPAYRAWDPTWIMFISFTVFFAMIVSDAAYGLVYGLGLGLVWRRLSGTETLRRLRNLFLALVLATIGWGVLAGSYFGTTPTGLAAAQLQVEGQPLLTHKDAMMMLSLGIGVSHLVLANLITAWQNRGQSVAWSAVGWALGIAGGYVLGLFNTANTKASQWLAETWGQGTETFQPALKQIGWSGLIGGLALILLFSSRRPLWSRRPSDWGWRLVDGLLGLTNVTKAFGDTLSYLRLFALGFASAQLAVTFNNMAVDLYGIPGIGLVLAGLVLLFGHGVNLALGIMGGVVHGLRLNCIEFFNWSLTEEGQPFRAFRKKAT